MAMQKLAMAFAMLMLPQVCDGKGLPSPDPLARLHAGAGQWDASQAAVLPASHTEPVLTSPPVNVLPPPAETWRPAGAPSGHVVAPCCECEDVYRSCSWLFALELVPSDSQVTRAPFGEWPDNEPGITIRFLIGYEDESGFGMRARFGGFFQEIDTSEWTNFDADQIVLDTSTFTFDFYKRLFLEDTEVVLGVGPAGGVLSFELTPDSPFLSVMESEFGGGGITAFVELWHPLARFERTDLGLAGRGRVYLLEGEWDDNSGILVPETNDDRMHVAEVAFGLELRRRFGEKMDRYWYIAWLAEHQTWNSAWMSRFAATSVGFTGTNITFGLAW